LGFVSQPNLRDRRSHYLVADNDGQQSEEATVTVNVANAAPKITEIQIPDTITEGDEVELEAIALY
jgi:hypothetical protein